MFKKYGKAWLPLPPTKTAPGKHEGQHSDIKRRMDCFPLNRWLIQANMPERWQHSTIKVLYKGKGDTRDPDVYIDIALE